MADLLDFEFARDRIMMGIERKSLSMSDKERLNTAIHEAGHAITCYFTEGAKNLYKATIVARGGSLGAVSSKSSLYVQTYMVPDEGTSHNMTKEKVLAEIDVAMGGHVAEKLLIGERKISSGCGSDLQGASGIAYQAVRMYGMFGEEDAGFISSTPEETSDSYNAKVDREVKRILDDSYKRVEQLLTSREKELRELAKNLFWYDYLDQHEMELIIDGKKLDKEKVRNWTLQEKYIINF